jgi:predicted membrane protein (TIGR00267 family)
MMKEELGLFEERFENPLRIGLVMFFTFMVGGLIPIIPFLLISAPQSSLMAASFMTFASLFLIGVWKTTFTNKQWFVSGLEMVFTGILAAVIPYFIGELLLSILLSKVIS